MFLIDKSICHLVVEAKLMVLEAGQDQALELEADYEHLQGVGQGGGGAALMSAKRASQTAWPWQQQTVLSD